MDVLELRICSDVVVVEWANGLGLLFAGGGVGIDERKEGGMEEDRCVVGRDLIVRTTTRVVVVLGLIGPVKACIEELVLLEAVGSGRLSVEMGTTSSDFLLGA